MEETDKKNLRIFYLTLAVILTTVAIIVIAVAVARRSSPITEGTDTLSSTAQDSQDINTSLDGESGNSLPTFISPLKECQVDVDYSDTVLVFSPTMNDYRTHTALDLTAEVGQEVVAVADGVVKNVWQDYFMGTCVAIEHSGNAVSYYKSLDPTVDEKIVIGASVKAGDVIGTVGDSARNEVAQDPHLHFELMVNDKHVDPKKHIKFPSQESNEGNQ